jgi:hypothetical protein
METPVASRVPIVALALPWLDDELREMNAVDVAGLAPALASLLERSSADRRENLDWRAWLLAHVTDGAAWLRWQHPGPTRRLLALASASSPGPDASAKPPHIVATWACAEPVHLATGIDHLSLEPSLAVPLTRQEADDLAATLNAALAERGWSVVPLDPGRWLLACAEPIECETSPPTDAAGRAVRAHLPEGRDARRVRSIMNEMQMILHAHPVNEQRSARGQQTVNAVWLWGFGPVREIRAIPLPKLATDDHWLTELWLLHGQVPVEVAAGAFDGGIAAHGLLVAATAPPASRQARRAAPAATSSERRVTIAELPRDERIRGVETAVFAPLASVTESRVPVTVALFSGHAVRRFVAPARRPLLRRWLSWARGRR